MAMTGQEQFLEEPESDTLDGGSGASGSGPWVCAAPAVPTPVDEIVRALRSVELLHGLTDEEYLWLATHATERVGPDQAIVFREGEPASQFSIVLKGEIAVYRKHAGSNMLAIGRVGQLTGKLPFSRMKAWGASGSSTGAVWILDIREELFPEMLRAIPSMGQLCVSLLVDRTREFTRAEQQAEKLDALGKLAANLSHELKNPASAAQRAAGSLLLAVDREEELCRLGRLFASEEELRAFLQWTRKTRAAVRADTASSALSESDREEEFLRWMEARAIPEAWKLAPAYAAAHLPTASLDELAGAISARALPAAVAGFAASLNARLTAATIADSSARIFNIIDAVQGYANMDQTPLQEVDLIQSVDRALTLLHSQSTGIHVVRDYNPATPAITGYAGELSQVWSALIENAFTAMHGHGTLKVTIAFNAETAFVEFWDNGPGIDPAIASRIFEPFFTTKPLGQALGLGLDIVRRVVNKHLGSVTMQSHPHDTCFQVRLPLNRPQVY